MCLEWMIGCKELAFYTFSAWSWVALFICPLNKPWIHFSPSRNRSQKKKKHVILHNLPSPFSHSVSPDITQSSHQSQESMVITISSTSHFMGMGLREVAQHYMTRSWRRQAWDAHVLSTRLMFFFCNMLIFLKTKLVRIQRGVFNR